jgi:hypothetical protein
MLVNSKSTLQASSFLLDSGLPITQEWFYPLGGKVQVRASGA